MVPPGPPSGDVYSYQDEPTLGQSASQSDLSTSSTATTTTTSTGALKRMPQGTQGEYQLMRLKVFSSLHSTEHLDCAEACPLLK